MIYNNFDLYHYLILFCHSFHWSLILLFEVKGVISVCVNLKGDSPDGRMSGGYYPITF